MKICLLFYTAKKIITIICNNKLINKKNFDIHNFLLLIFNYFVKVCFRIYAWKENLAPINHWQLFFHLKKIRIMY